MYASINGSVRRVLTTPIIRLNSVDLKSAAAKTDRGCRAEQRQDALGVSLQLLLVHRTAAIFRQIS